MNNQACLFCLSFECAGECLSPEFYHGTGRGYATETRTATLLGNPLSFARVCKWCDGKFIPDYRYNPSSLYCSSQCSFAAEY